MSVRWAIVLHQDLARNAGPLRPISGTEVCEEGSTVWIRGEGSDDELELRLRGIPGASRYTVLPDGQLLAPGARVPKGRLPEGPWLPLRQWIAVELPTAGLAGRLAARSPLELVRSSCEREARILLTNIQSWRAHCDTAPQVRLDRWHFALRADGRVVVLGNPLPSICGQRFAENHGVAIPIGWAFSPRVDGEVLRELFGLESGDLAICSPDGSWQRIGGYDFVRATRSAVRTSAEGLIDV